MALTSSTSSSSQPAPPGSSGSDPGLAAERPPGTCSRARGARLLRDPIGLSALPFLLETRERPELPPAPRRGLALGPRPGERGRSCGSDPSWKRECGGQGRGRRRELEAHFAGAGFGAGVERGCWKRALPGQGVSVEGARRRHLPGTRCRTESRQIFVSILFGRGAVFLIAVFVRGRS